MAGSAFIVWTIRLALVCYVGSLGCLLAVPRVGHGLRRAARWSYTLGCMAYLAHVAAAFHFAHDWSYARAYEHTAERTEEVIGWRWGGGLYVNYLFTLLWAADVAWWWASPASYRARPVQVAAALHAFMLFLAFNATVVFGVGVIRWWGLAATFALAAAWWRWRATSRPSPANQTTSQRSSP